MNKKSKKVSRRILVLLLVLVATLTGVNLTGTLEQQADTEVSAISLDKTENIEALKIYVLDVGQGNAALFQQGEQFMLIDGGDREYSSYVVSFLKQLGVKKLDYVVATHYDADHLNGIVGALNVFECGMILAPDYETDSRVYQSFLRIVEEKEIPLIHPKIKDEYVFAGSTFQIVAPVKYQYAEANSNSLGIRLEHGKNSFLICGDCTSESEMDILYADVEVASDVFVLNHHGSQSANTEEFLEAVEPQAVIISCGMENGYGHPHASVMKRVQDSGADLYRTDLQGLITATSDGNKIIFENEVCMDYRSGSEIVN